MMNQREAVYAGIQSIKPFDDGDTVTLTSDEKANLVSILCAGFEAAEITMSEKACDKYLGNPKELKGYVGGLINNWVRKDTRMNGGDKYVTKNPGSRAGSGDTVVKNLKALRSTISDETKLAEIDSAIASRQAEIKVAKAKTVEVNIDLIPAELREKLGL